MDEVLEFSRGRVPLLISIPHAGTRLTPEVEAALIPRARSLPDTDRYLPRLYDFAAGLGASLLVGRYSRYVVDLNRPPDDSLLYTVPGTGLFPATFLDGTPLFLPGQEPGAAQRAGYLERVWKPYHATLAQELARLKAEFGYALLFDAHSIRAEVPWLFEGRLPDLNLGTHSGASCTPELAERLMAVCAAAEGYSRVLDGRFTGGYITRCYGRPGEGIHAVQLELVQCRYMEEDEPFRYREDLAGPTRDVLRALLEAMLAWGREQGRRNL
ncbi:N-formylglutamate deformylase [Azotobacter beijerinckii]|uniref:Formiminoglutamase n=1 Tax=Azotobacter beijerinckii TaxID=170623 RepID=A0A1I4BX51_9GAMM|nr:N-formylglutamate deformylase [Azotobacter beijerinckii]SFB40345.1 formiminoglutamase [Azotobacter beijerinckii]SFK73000.1 formiminoglutamase [Azotobacter beijerinckii]